MAKVEHTLETSLGKLKKSLTKISVEVSATTHATTTAGISTVPSTEVRACLGSCSAVDELILIQASAGTAFTGEDTGVHVGCALGTDNGHGVSVHVDFSGNVDDAVGWSESCLTPGVKDLTVDQRTAAVNWGPCTRPARRERDGLAAVLRDGDGDLWFDGVDP